MENNMAKVITPKTSQKALRKLKTRVFGIKKDISESSSKNKGRSQKLSEDPFKQLSEENRVIEPPFDMLTLAMLPENNTEMRQCIDAMVTNIGGFGHRYVPRLKSNPKDKISKNLEKKILLEKIKLENFFMYCTAESFTKFREKLDRDYETIGNSFMEVIRDNRGDIQGFTHLPAYQMRLCLIEEEWQFVNRPILKLQGDLSVKIVKVKQYKRFRRYVQSRSIRKSNLDVVGKNKFRWFKEFGDERVYDNRTGEVVPKGKKINQEYIANEVIHNDLYCTRSPYGLPRYIGNLLTILGDRASEEINFTTFQNNNVPSMVIAISNGQLTEGSIDRIESFVESQIQGSDNYSKFLLVEAEGIEEGEDGGQPKLEIKPLVSEQHTDALFQVYSGNNQDKIRRVWRLPPIFVGRSDEYNRSTAESSRRLADEQVFAPERDNFDSLMNRILFPHMGVLYHKFKSNSPNTTDNTQLVKILAGAEKTGGMTPRIARILLEDILGIELPDHIGDYDPDLPFSLTMAEAVKNMADPVEPGQQVTAMKILERLVEIKKGDSELDSDFVNNIIDLQGDIEKRWNDKIGKTEDVCE